MCPAIPCPLASGHLGLALSPASLARPLAHTQGLSSALMPERLRPPGRDSITDTDAGRVAEAVLPGDRLPGF